MPKGSSPERLKNIQALGSDASITDLCYDDAVQLANTDAKKLGGALIQDTDWEGYTEVPTWIMQGYTTMALEAVQQLKDIKPTHGAQGACQNKVSTCRSNDFTKSILNRSSRFS